MAVSYVYPLYLRVEIFSSIIEEGRGTLKQHHPTPKTHCIGGIKYKKKKSSNSVAVWGSQVSNLRLPMYLEVNWEI